MAAFSSKTLFALFLLAMATADNVVSRTTTFSYDKFNPKPKHLIFQGDAFVPASSSSVRLTKVDASRNPVSYSVGRVVYAPPVPFWDTGLEATFETTIKFSITSVDSDPADGLTFFIIPVDSSIPNPSTGGSLGLFDLYTGNATSVFAVEFDIFYGSDNTWDPQYPHIGIDINSRVSKKVSRFEDALGKVVTARIKYEENTRTISVVANYGGKKNATLSYVFDLKTILPKQVQVGISAATGESVALHDLHAWYFTSTPIWDRPTPASTNPYNHYKKIH